MDMGSNPISAISDCMNWVGHSSPGSQVPREEKDTTTTTPIKGWQAQGGQDQLRSSCKGPIGCKAP